MLRYAYNATFVRTNIITTFEEAGTWLVDHRKLMSANVHRSANDEGTIITVPQLDTLYQAERLVARRRILGDNITVTKQSFVNTTAGAVLTCEAAIKMTAGRLRRDAERLAEKAAAAARREEKKVERAEKKCAAKVSSGRRRKVVVSNYSCRWARPLVLQPAIARRRVQPGPAAALSQAVDHTGVDSFLRLVALSATAQYLGLTKFS